MHVKHALKFAHVQVLRTSMVRFLFGFRVALPPALCSPCLDYYEAHVDEFMRSNHSVAIVHIQSE